jgi:hypothetical protein
MVGRGRLCVHGCNLVCALFVVVLERSERGMHLWHSLLRCVCVCGTKVGASPGQARPSITLLFRGGSKCLRDWRICRS